MAEFLQLYRWEYFSIFLAMELLDPFAKIFVCHRIMDASQCLRILCHKILELLQSPSLHRILGGLRRYICFFLKSEQEEEGASLFVLSTTRFDRRCLIILLYGCQLLSEVALRY